jgi:hypothetical protein
MDGLWLEGLYPVLLGKNIVCAKALVRLQAFMKQLVEFPLGIVLARITIGFALA